VDNLRLLQERTKRVPAVNGEKGMNSEIVGLSGRPLLLRLRVSVSLFAAISCVESILLTDSLAGSAFTSRRGSCVESVVWKSALGRQ
jgi:hypothetical protein